MKELALEIRLLSPALLAAAPPASNLTDTLPFIPGNSVRGLLARRAIDKGWDPGDHNGQFGRVFVDGQVRFGFATLEGAQVLPRSARTCKYTAGFKGAGGHGVLDLLDILLKGVASTNGAPVAGASTRLGGSSTAAEPIPRLECPECGLGLDYFEGYYLVGGVLRKVVPRMRIITRTAIDPVRGTARTGSLFSETVLEEGQPFFARLEVSDDLGDCVEDLVDSPFNGVVGRGGSRGQGWVEVASAEDIPSEAKGTAQQRCDKFVEVARRPVLVVTLLADGLFRDDYLRDATAPTAADLEPLGIDPRDWQERPSAAFSAQRRIFGFDGEPILLPRSHRVAVAAGSTFLYELQNSTATPTVPFGDGRGWIGEGSREGYGRAVLWHGFHLSPEGKAS